MTKQRICENVRTPNNQRSIRKSDYVTYSFLKVKTLFFFEFITFHLVIHKYNLNNTVQIIKMWYQDSYECEEARKRP